MSDSLCLQGSKILSQVADSPGHRALVLLRHRREDSSPYRHVPISVCWEAFLRSEAKNIFNVLRRVSSSVTLGQCGQIRHLIFQGGCNRLTALPVDSMAYSAIRTVHLFSGRHGRTNWMSVFEPGVTGSIPVSPTKARRVPGLPFISSLYTAFAITLCVIRQALDKNLRSDSELRAQHRLAFFLESILKRFGRE